MQSKEYVGYVISVKKFKEKDSIIRILTQDKILTVFGRSYRSLKSKYHSLNNILIKVRVIGKDENKFILLDYDILDYSLVNHFDYDAFLSLSKIINIIGLSERVDKNLFQAFEEVVNNFTQENYRVYLAYILASILSANNVHLKFDSCVDCGSKEGLITFSFYDGGLLCKRCYQNQKLKSIEEIKEINIIFNGKIKDIEKIKIKDRTLKEIEYLLNESLGIYIKE